MVEHEEAPEVSPQRKRGPILEESERRDLSLYLKLRFVQGPRHSYP